MKVALVLALLFAIGCSSDKPTPAPAPATPDAHTSGCDFVFSGNTPTKGTRDNCASVEPASALVDAGPEAGSGDAGPDDAGSDADAAADTQFLVVDFSNDLISFFHAQIALGDHPRAGSFSSETLSDWNITAGTPTGCSFVAGNEVVPTGSFMLELDALPGNTADAGSLRGKFDATLTLHAASGMDCGPGDNESVGVVF